MGANMTAAVFDRQHALKQIAECKRVASDRNTLTVRTDSTNYRLGQLLAEICDGRYVEEVHGMKFAEYVEANFVDERGQPRGYDWARGLSHYYRTVSRWPVLIDKLGDIPRPGQPYVSFSSAFFTSRLAASENWEKRARRQANEEIKPGDDSPESYVARDALTHQLLDEWLIECALRTTRDIRHDLALARRAEEGIPVTEMESWPFVGGKVDPNVHAHGRKVVEQLCNIENDGPDPDTLSFVQSYERLVGFSDDCIEAFKALVEGNNGPLTSLIEQWEDSQGPS
jgi:hypothetical protein